MWYYGYEYNKNRVWERSTAAHSTVEINGENSSEFGKASELQSEQFLVKFQIQKRKSLF